ncbi:hypothetical protein HK096_009835, partial [Nowakowskiella sp. JEL0078]
MADIQTQAQVQVDSNPHIHSVESCSDFVKWPEAIVLYNFKHADGNEDNIDFKTGDILTVLSDEKNGWSMVCKEGEIGLIPSTYITINRAFEKSAMNCVAPNPPTRKRAIKTKDLTKNTKIVAFDYHQSDIEELTIKF